MLNDSPFSLYNVKHPHLISPPVDYALGHQFEDDIGELDGEEVTLSDMEACHKCWVRYQTNEYL